MRTYKQLTSGKRYQISALKRMGHNLTEIAKELEVHKSTISRELCRNAGERGYRPKQADEKASESLVRAAMSQLQLSARAYHRILKLARTIADLAESEEIQSTHLAEALQYRPKIMMG
ncbi:MAG: helix-turn-helix domain-containing protein [Chloroflexi bacterium]|nr:helix-turn-helix domain-containing protein [Chloroflexota bacterium]